MEKRDLRVNLELKEGLVIRDPFSLELLKGQFKVELSTFWRRRIAEGDVTILKTEFKKKIKKEFSHESKKGDK